MLSSCTISPVSCGLYILFYRSAVCLMGFTSHVSSFFNLSTINILSLSLAFFILSAFFEFSSWVYFHWDPLRLFDLWCYISQLWEIIFKLFFGGSHTRWCSGYSNSVFRNYHDMIRRPSRMTKIEIGLALCKSYALLIILSIHCQLWEILFFSFYSGKFLMDDLFKCCLLIILTFLFCEIPALFIYIIPVNSSWRSLLFS